MSTDRKAARAQLERTRDRLVGILEELRGIDADFEVIGQHLEGDAGPHNWLPGRVDQIDALVAVVDLLTTTRFGLERISGDADE